MAYTSKHACRSADDSILSMDNDELTPSRTRDSKKYTV